LGCFRQIFRQKKETLKNGRQNLIRNKLKFDTTKTQAKSNFSNTVEIKNQKSNQTEAKFGGLDFVNFTLGKMELSSTKKSLRR
jgi:hypothetical protein